MVEKALGNAIQEKIYKKSIIINLNCILKDLEQKNLLLRMSTILIDFMFENYGCAEFFTMCLKDSKKVVNAKELVLEWVVSG